MSAETSVPFSFNCRVVCKRQRHAFMSAETPVPCTFNYHVVCKTVSCSYEC